MEGTMKGLVKVSKEKGAVLRTDLPIPKIKDNEVLVKVRCAAICGTDQHIFHWNDWAEERVPVPMVFGHEFSGDVVEVGSSVSGIKVGDRVAGETHIPCGNCYPCQTGDQHNCENMKIIGVHVPGAFCEYIAVPKECIWLLGKETDYVIGSMLEPMGVAVHGVMSGHMSVSAKTVLILGCGPIGVMAVGAAHAAGASKVIAVDIFPEKLSMANDMGADVLINTKEKDLIAAVKEETLGRGADIIIDYTGNVKLIESTFDCLAKGGRYTFVGLPNNKLSLDLTTAMIYKEATVNGVTGRRMYETWWQCDALIKSGKCDISKVIGGKYQLEEFEQAFSDIDSGKAGKLIFMIQ